jgi:putative transposase
MHIAALVMLDAKALPELVLKAAEAGEKGTDLCRKHGISEQTLYRWKANYDGMDVGEARRLKQLEDENRSQERSLAACSMGNLGQPISSGNDVPGNHRSSIAVTRNRTLCQSPSSQVRSLCLAPIPAARLDVAHRDLHAALADLA